MKISLCTTCCNRLGQFEQTFEANAEQILAYPEVEWVIVNFNSADALDRFMGDRLGDLPERIVYVRESSGRSWHASIAKNVAHRHAAGRVLMNLDCDNLIGDALEVVEEYFGQHYRLAHLWTGVLGDGTYGRIAIDRELFHALGGYDESFYPMAYQDADLVARAAAMQARCIRVPSPEGLALVNSKTDSLRNCRPDGLTWHDYNQRNRARSQANIAAGHLVANLPHGWSPMKVEIQRGRGRS